MDFAFNQEQENFRKKVREFAGQNQPHLAKWQRPYFDFYSHYKFIGEYTRTTSKKLGVKGWLRITWPIEYGGQNAPSILRIILTEELERAGCPAIDIFGATIIAPTLLEVASEEQKNKYLSGIGKGEIFWCECLSETDSGSDLASIKTQAQEYDDYFLINGQKVWTSGAHQADWCILLARSDLRLPRHRGLTVFVVDMHSKGISVKPLINMAGDHEFNEVYFDDVRVPKENLVGIKNEGWAVIRLLLNLERWAIPFYSIAERYLRSVVEWVKQEGNLRPHLRNRIAELFIECEIGKLLVYRAALMQDAGSISDSIPAIVKLFNTELNQKAAALGMEVFIA